VALLELDRRKIPNHPYILASYLFITQKKEKLEIYHIILYNYCDMYHYLSSIFLALLFFIFLFLFLSHVPAAARLWHVT
jgi:hypothetical protein